MLGSRSVKCKFTKNVRINTHVFGVVVTNLKLNAQLCDEAHNCSLTMFGPLYQILSQMEEKFRTHGEKFYLLPCVNYARYCSDFRERGHCWIALHRDDQYLCCSKRTKKCKKYGQHFIYALRHNMASQNPYVLNGFTYRPSIPNSTQIGKTNGQFLNAFFKDTTFKRKP